MKRLLKNLFLPIALIFIGISFTGAYFTDSVMISGNIYGAPGPEPLPGDIVINEIMWMGSADLNNPADDGPTDQWIELKNVSDRDLHLSGLLYVKSKQSPGDITVLSISDNRVIKSGTFFLASKYTKQKSVINVNPDTTDIANFAYDKMKLELWYKSNLTPVTAPHILIDRAGDGISTPIPAEGNGTLFYSMQRNVTPGDGADYTNWNTCVANTSSYWDSGRTEKGTPGGPNV